MATQLVPVWDGRQVWDGDPMAVRLEDWGEFVRVNQVVVVRPVGMEDVGWDVQVVSAREVGRDVEGMEGWMGNREGEMGASQSVAGRESLDAVGKRGQVRTKAKAEGYQVALWDGVEAGGVMGE